MSDLFRIQKKMSQIFEYTKHSDRYLIHHFSFGGYADMSIGHFVGNYSMNKFMSLLEWRMIFKHLDKLIEKYLKKPQTKRTNVLVDLADTNIELNVGWTGMDADFYGKLFPVIDLDMVYPFVMVVEIGYKSNMNKFVLPAGEGSDQTTNNLCSQKNVTFVPKAKTSTTETPTAKIVASTSNTKMLNASASKSPVASTSNTEMQAPKSSTKSKDSLAVSTSVTVGSIVDLTLLKTIGSNGTRPFTIPLNRLTADEIDRLTGSNNSTCSTVPTGNGKKRKHESLNDSVSTPKKEMPTKRPAPETPFVNSVNSTPYVRLSKIELDPIEKDVSRISSEDDKSKKTKAGPKSSKTKKIYSNGNKNRLTKTQPSSKRTAAKSARPRLQVSIGHLTAKPKKLSKVKKSMHKDKKNKKSSKLVNGESSSLENKEGNTTDPSQQPSTSRASNNKENHRPKLESYVNPQPIDLKNLTEDEVIAGFYRNGKMLKALLEQNVRQEEIQRASDYTPIDIITLLTHQQFAQMLDILYEQFKGYPHEECETIFFEIMIPEWALSMFMRKTSLQRDAAIEMILSQKTENHDQSTMLSYISLREE